LILSYCALKPLWCILKASEKILAIFGVLKNALLTGQRKVI
jgi:hypothetical protein